MTEFQRKCLQYDEERIRKQLENIQLAKEIGVSQSTIDKMISLVTYEKEQYDERKAKWESS